MRLYALQMRSRTYLTEHAHDDVLPTHRHRQGYASLVLDGDHVECSPDGPMACEPGTLILHPRFHAHGNRFGRRGARVLNIELADSFAPDSLRSLQVANIREARQIFEHGPQRLAELIATANTLVPTASHEWLPEFVHRLQTTEMALGEIARKLGISAAHASRSVQKSHGMSPQLLRRELRRRHAMSLLCGDMPIIEIAALSGFSDQSHLTRLVRELTGLPPATWRRQVKCVQDSIREPAADCA